jgi:hypothetical protein
MVVQDPAEENKIFKLVQNKKQTFFMPQKETLTT